MTDKIRRAWPVAKLVAQFGFSAGMVLILVSVFCGERYLVTGLAVGVFVFGAAAVVSALIMLAAPFVLDDDRRGPGGRP